MVDFSIFSIMCFIYFLIFMWFPLLTLNLVHCIFSNSLRCNNLWIFMHIFPNISLYILLNYSCIQYYIGFRFMTESFNIYIFWVLLTPLNLVTMLSCKVITLLLTYTPSTFFTHPYTSSSLVTIHWFFACMSLFLNIKNTIWSIFKSYYFIEYKYINFPCLTSTVNLAWHFFSLKNDSSI